MIDDRPKKEKGNVQSDIRNVVYCILSEFLPLRVGLGRVLTIAPLIAPLIVPLRSGKCTGKDNEAQKEDPGEEFRIASVEVQELPLAQPLLRIGHPRGSLYTNSWGWGWGWSVLIIIFIFIFLEIRRGGC